MKACHDTPRRGKPRASRTTRLLTPGGLLALLPILLLAGACRPAAKPKAAEQPAPPPTAAAASPVPPAKERAEQIAQRRAAAWLSLIDEGQYAASWEAACAMFRASTSKDQWNAALAGARGHLGPLTSRKLRAAQYETSLDGAPPGKYVVVHYDSAFAKKPGTREIVTLLETPDASWKVLGYFVQ
jgi:hypothetical protein